MRFWLYFGFADVTIAMENIMNKIKITIQKKTNQPTTIIRQSRRKYRFGAIYYEKKEMLHRMCNMHSTKSQRVHGLSSVVAFLMCFAFIQLDCFARWFCQQMNVMRRTTVQHKSIHRTGNKFIQQFATDQETPSETCGLSLNWNQIQAISLCVHYESILSLSAIILGFSFHLYFPLNWWMILWIKRSNSSVYIRKDKFRLHFFIECRINFSKFGELPANVTLTDQVHRLQN